MVKIKKKVKMRGQKALKHFRALRALQKEKMILLQSTKRVTLKPSKSKSNMNLVLFQKA